MIQEIDSAIRMKIAFRKLLHCIVLISFLVWKERVCLLDVILSTSEWKGVSYLVQVLYWNKMFKVFIPRICWIYGNCLVNNSLNMLTLPFNPSREIFQGEIFLLMLLLSSQDFTGLQEFFYMWEISFTLVFTCLYLSLSTYRSILRLCDRKFVFVSELTGNMSLL